MVQTILIRSGRVCVIDHRRRGIQRWQYVASTDRRIAGEARAFLKRVPDPPAGG
jgi:hypothetical protein